MKICTAILLINLSGSPWTAKNLTTIPSAVKSCKKIYNSCLLKIVKKDELTYNAICGENKDGRSKETED